jgi:hypothetical protein
MGDAEARNPGDRALPTSGFHLDAISGAPYANTGHRSFKHERFTPLVPPFFMAASFANATIRSEPCCLVNILAFAVACEGQGRRPLQQRSRRAPQHYLAMQIRANLL